MEDKQNKPVYEERDASFDPDPVPETSLSEEELQDSILEDSGMNAFQKAIAKMSDKAWNIFQYICGAVLGLLASVALFWDGASSGSKEGGFSYSLIIAVLIALVVPNILERQGLRKTPKLRIVMAATLLVCIVAYLIIGVRMGFSFRG